jgi:hypothetical protein
MFRVRARRDCEPGARACCFERSPSSFSRLRLRVIGYLVGESALEADVVRRSGLVDDNPHGDAAGRADRRPLVLGLALALLFHAASLARLSWNFFGSARADVGGYSLSAGGARRYVSSKMPPGVKYKRGFAYSFSRRSENA